MENFKLFSKIFKSNPLPMLITNIENNKIDKVNPAFLNKTGYSEKEIIGKSIKELDVFIDYEKLRDVSRKLKTQDEIKDEELFIRCKDGKILNGIFSVGKVNSKGTGSYLTIITDITEKVTLTKQLEKECQKLINIIEGTNLGTWEWDIQTNEVQINEQWSRMLGYSLEELQPISFETWFKLGHVEDLKISRELMKKHLNGETQYYDCEIRMRHKNGRWIWIHNKGKIIEYDEYGNPITAFGTHSDITLRKDVEEKLKENEKRFFLALDKTKAGLWDMDLINDDVFLSNMWKSILGYKEDEIENSFESWKRLWHPNDKEKIEKILKDYFGGKTKNYELVHRLKHKDGSWRWILSRSGVLRNENDEPYRWIGTNIDITEVHEQTQEFERFFSMNLDLFCVIDMEGIIIKVNKTWEDILGYSSDDLNGCNILEFIHKDDIDSTLQIMERLKENKKVDLFINRYMHKNGSYHYLEWRASSYEGLIYAATRDITERIHYEKKILEISNRDTLTGAYNRHYVYNRAKEIIEEYKRTEKVFSVSILDIDHFKAINDNYGHITGDYILKEFTRVIGENLRPYDILGRYGGEEFIVILNHADKKEGNLILKRILNIVRNKTFTFDGNDIMFTFSAGISSCKEIGKKEIIIDDLIDIADKRMYKAKNTGRNKIVY